RDRRYSNHDATIPGDQKTGCPPPVLSCTAWGFSCGTNYSVPGELLPRLFTLAYLCCQRTGGVFSVTLSVTAILQLRYPRVLRGMLPCGVRTFLQRTYGSPAIACHQRYFSAQL